MVSREAELRGGLKLPDLFGAGFSGITGDREGLGEAIVVRNEAAERQGIRVSEVRRKRLEQDVLRRVVLEGCDGRSDLLGSGVFIVVDEVGGGGVCKR